MTVFGYFRGEPGRGEAQQPAVKALLAFGTAHGLDIELRGEADQSRPSKMSERTTGGVVLRNLQAGDTLLLPNIAEGFDVPSDLLEVARKCAGRGALLRVASWATHSGPLELAGELAAAFAGLEKECERLRGELEVVQRDAEARLEACTRETIQVLGERFHEFVGGLPQLGDVREARPEQHAGEHIGVALARRAERLGLSQAEISRRTGVPQASVSRAFTQGVGSAIEPISKLLWPAAEPKTEGWQPAPPDGRADAAAALSTFKERR
jgi:hypothetical protein